MIIYNLIIINYNKNTKIDDHKIKYICNHNSIMINYKCNKQPSIKPCTENFHRGLRRIFTFVKK